MLKFATLALLIALATARYYGSYGSTGSSTEYSMTGPLEVPTAKASFFSGFDNVGNVTFEIGFDTGDTVGVIEINDVNSNQACSAELTPVGCSPYSTSFFFKLDDIVGNWNSNFLPCVAFDAARGFNNSGISISAGTTGTVTIFASIYNPNPNSPTWRYIDMYTSAKTAGTSFLPTIPCTPATSGQTTDSSTGGYATSESTSTGSYGSSESGSYGSSESGSYGSSESGSSGSGSGTGDSSAAGYSSGFTGFPAGTSGNASPSVSARPRRL